MLQPPNLYYLAIKYFYKILVALPIRITTNSQDYPANTPKIFAANHPSTMDPVMLITILKEPVSTLITQSAFDVSFVSWMIQHAKQIPVVPGQGRQAYLSSVEMLHTGHNLLNFPEGALSHDDGTTKEPYSGTVRLAMETGSPIVPIGISMTKDRCHHWTLYINGQAEASRFFLRGKYVVTFGRPYCIKGDNSDKKLVDKYKSELMVKINQLAQQSATIVHGQQKQN